MADIEENDDIETLGEVDEDQEELRKVLRDAMGAETGPDPLSDDIVLDPLETGELKTVTADEGMQILDKARDGKPADPPAADSKAEGEEGQEGKADDPPADPPSEMDALLQGLDPERAATVKGRLETLAGFEEMFTTNKDQLAAIAPTPKEAIGNLLHLHQYANKNPDQYIAWAAAQLGGERAEEVITKAAEHLGLKISRPEDDAFEDEEVKRLREENRALKAQGRRLPFGPDIQQPQDQIASFATEKNPDGSATRPHWNDLMPIVAARATAARQHLGRPVTPAEIDGFYREEEAKMRGLFAPAAPAQPTTPPPAAPANPTPAAPAAPPVAEQDVKKAAPAPQSAKDKRAMDASKQLDGTGQGADRHSAPPDGDLRSTIAHFLRAGAG